MDRADCQVKTLGIMGGTFNPPHNGHLHAARQAYESLGLDGLLLIPDNIPPHKQMPENTADSGQRLEMTRLAAKLLPNAQVTDMELRRGGRSYTVDTLTELKAQYPDTALYFIMGTDMLLTFDRWYQPEEISRLTSLAVIAREDDDRSALERKAQELNERWGTRVALVDCPALPMSSSELRLEQQRIADSVPQTVYDYIREHRLYGCE